MDQLGIDAVLGHFRYDPHHSSVSSADHSNHGCVLLRELFEMAEALIAIGPHVVEVDAEELAGEGEVDAIDLQLHQRLAHAAARTAIHEQQNRLTLVLHNSKICLLMFNQPTYTLCQGHNCHLDTVALLILAA